MKLIKFSMKISRSGDNASCHTVMMRVCDANNILRLTRGLLGSFCPRFSSTTKTSYIVNYLAFRSRLKGETMLPFFSAGENHTIIEASSLIQASFPGDVISSGTSPQDDSPCL